MQGLYCTRRLCSYRHTLNEAIIVYTMYMHCMNLARLFYLAHTFNVSSFGVQEINDVCLVGELYVIMNGRCSMFVNHVYWECL